MSTRVSSDVNGGSFKEMRDNKIRETLEIKSIWGIDVDYFHGPSAGASSGTLLKEALWYDLLSIMSSRDGIWLLMGDFNVVRSKEERAGSKLMRRKLQVSTTLLQVLVNGSPTNEFCMERGLRQGDPLSPFFFLIVAEAHQVIILESCNKGIFKGLKLKDEATNISLLQYADDALIFGEWSRRNVKNLISILNSFRNVSGLGVNLSKSSIFGVGVNMKEVKNVASSSNCKFGSLPFIYLGLPVGRDMSKVTNWSDIIDRFNKRLSSWKAKNLSFGGRLTLSKVVLGSLPTYYLSLFRAPKELINSLEKFCSRFFWGFKEGEKGIVWVKWKSILVSFDKGGLGVGSVHAKNLSLLAKWR
ncbi:reverse transcriptase domain, reverse transcriptase zinc-binding domain protein [Tanacetum coccineum]